MVSASGAGGLIGGYLANRPARSSGAGEDTVRNPNQGLYRCQPDPQCRGHGDPGVRPFGVVVIRGRAKWNCSD